MAMPVDFTISVTVERPPDEVFAVLTDPQRLPEWQPLVEHVEVLAGGPPLRRGSRVREVRRAGPKRLEQIVEISDHEPPERFGLRIVEGPVHIHGDVVLRRLGEDATEVRVRAFGRAPRAMRLLGPLLEPLLARQLRKQYVALKTLVESSASPVRAGQLAH